MQNTFYGISQLQKLCSLPNFDFGKEHLPASRMGLVTNQET